MKKEIIDITKDLMSFKTHKDNKYEFNKLFNYIKNKFNKLIIKEEIIKDNKCLILSNIDSYEFDLVFCCHVDVVDTDNWDINEDKNNIYGRGSIDMKGGVAVSLATLNDYVGDLKVGVILTSDEEIDGYSCKKLLEKYSTKLVIIPDGGSNFDLIHEEKGLLQLELTLVGKSAHASQPWNGINAIDELYKVYKKIIKKYPLPKNSNDYKTSINLGMITGGSNINSVPDKCSMKLDIRYTSDTNKDEIIDFIKSINKDIDINIVLESSIFKCDIKNKMISKYIDCSKIILNRDINIIGCESSSDAVYFYEKNIPTIIMNPVGGYPHGKGEFVNKKSLEDLYEIYSLFLKEVEIYD